MSQLIPAWQAELEAETPPPSLRRIVIASALVIGIGFGGFLVWAFLARLDSAVPAPGAVVVEAKRKTISLPGSGTLRALYVHEGQSVAAGQALFKLDDIQAQAAEGSLKVQRLAVMIRIARLKAEQDGAAEIRFPAALQAEAAEVPAAVDLMANERHVHADRMRAYQGQIAIQRKKSSQLEEQIKALEANATAVRQRLEIIDKESKDVNTLLQQGFATQTRLYDLLSLQADLRGTLGDLASRQAAARQAIAQTELEMVSLDDQRRQEVSRELQEAEAQAADLTERLRGARDVLAKTTVAAPEAGIVTDLKFFTPGSAIAAGQPVVDIEPAGGKMLVEVNVRPEDIEHVHAGQKVNVRLTAYKQHRVPVLTGSLTYVSADRQLDPKGEPYFLARAQVDPAALAAATGVALSPGMPVEVLILGGARRAIDYFISPITDSLHQSLREE